MRSLLYGFMFCMLSACLSTHIDHLTTKQIVIRGVVTEIAPTSVTEISPGWTITIRVENVESGSYSEPDFRFGVHSPSMSGLLVGEHYLIVAIASKTGYTVDESQWVKRGEAKW